MKRMMRARERRRTPVASRAAVHSAIAYAAVALAGYSGEAIAQDASVFIERLQAPEAEDRARAACELGRMGTPAVRKGTQQLLELLSDRTPVDGWACRGVEEPWGSLMEGSSPGREAAITLESAGADVLAPLARVLAKGSPIGRANAALALGLIEDASVLPALEWALLSDENAMVRERATWAIGMIGDARSLAALADGAGDVSPLVRGQVAWAFGRVESIDGVVHLRPLLGDPDAGVRERAAWALGMIRSPNGVDVLVHAMRDEAVEVREQAAWALGMIGIPTGVEALVAALDSDPYAAVRERSAWALGTIGDARVATQLMNAVRDEDDRVRERAIWALTRVLHGAGSADAISHSRLEAYLGACLPTDEGEHLLRLDGDRLLFLSRELFKWPNAENGTAVPVGLGSAPSARERFPRYAAEPDDGSPRIARRSAVRPPHDPIAGGF
ncbi:MAG: hypothetical protein GEU90_11300 [Gemmatimonas sp.]|nr:hypothetical protein [Gemmatimonas sp.]